MTLKELARAMVDDPEYGASLHARARAGTLPPDIELMLLEMADGRTPLSEDRPPEHQSRTLALVRPEVRP